MNIDQLRKQFPDEDACRLFFESILWKQGHAIRQIMDQGSDLLPALNGIVEQDEKYIGGKPRYQKGVVHKRGKGAAKQ